MSYEEALTAAGAEVLAYEEFGSYQGDWLACFRFVGEVGYIRGYYGSCSGCDAFEAEFGIFDDDRDDYQDRLREFGEGYLEDIWSFDKALDWAAEQAEWDADADDILKFLERTNELYGRPVTSAYNSHTRNRVRVIRD